MPTLYKEKKNKGIKITRPSNVKQEQWDKAMNLYQVAKERGDKYPELTVAQAALETGWFKSPSGRFNYFGQKASKSQEGSYKNTKEVADDQFYSTKAKFRDYDSLGKAVDDRIEKWGSKYANADTVEDALYSIWKYDPEKGRGVGYATDDKYDVKIKSILGMMGVPMSKTAAKVQKEQTPSYQTDVVEETEKVQESTAVATNDYSREYELLQQQNNLLLQEREERIAKEEATTKAQQAQAKLDEKLRQRKFLEDLIMQTGVEYVERAPRESVYDQPQQQVFQDGGAHKNNPITEKEYYNPERREGISSGNKKLDFLYNNEWILKTPLVGDYIKDIAKDYASKSKGIGIVNTNWIDIINHGDEAKANYKGDSFKGDVSYNRPKLLDQYFSEEKKLPKANYKASSDYLEFLPTYSIKADFEKLYGDKIPKDRFKKVIEEVVTEDFFKTRKKVFKQTEDASSISELLNVDLGSHKIGAAWDEERNLPYISVADAWDFEPNSYSKRWKDYGDEEERSQEELKQNEDKAFIQSYLMHKVGKPFKVYDRFYFDPKTKEYIPDSTLSTKKQEQSFQDGGKMKRIKLSKRKK